MYHSWELNDTRISPFFEGFTIGGNFWVKGVQDWIEPLMINNNTIPRDDQFH